MKHLPLICLLLGLATASVSADEIRFNKDIRKLLSNACFHCHGPDAEDRKAGLRLDTREGALADNDGVRAIVPGDIDASELLHRITTTDPDEIMPPPGKGEALTPEQVALFRQWIEEGAEYETHWSYVAPEKPERPEVAADAPANWKKHPVDAFIHRRLKTEDLTPSAEADPTTLARRLALDLTGLPPTIAEVDTFTADAAKRGIDPALGAYVDGLLARPTFGEHWARMWLDLARYADSAGYADDPSRTIWAYRDYVIRAFNDNLPFDQFTTEQLAGDLLPDATEAQRIATAFHRNTQTNSEGGTNDEEFRNVAVVDRVNTTMATWMGTTMACAQCHTHKYDPITHNEYFSFFAIFNSTEDTDKKDERPTLQLYTETALAKRADLEAKIKDAEAEFKDPEIPSAELDAWAARFQAPSPWTPLVATKLETRSKATIATDKDGIVRISGEDANKDLYTLTGPIASEKPITAIKLDVLADKELGSNGPGRNGNFVLTELTATTLGADASTRSGRFVRLDLPGKGKFLHVAEVEAFANGENVARKGTAKQSTSGFGGFAKAAIDGVTNKGFSHTNKEDNPWWEVDFGKEFDLDRIVIWNRPDGNIQDRLDGFKLSVLDAKRNTVWEKTYAKAPKRELAAKLDGSTPAIFQANKISADFEQTNFTINLAADGKTGGNGWAIAPQMGKDHHAIFPLAKPISGDTLQVNLHHEYNGHVLGKFRVLTTTQANPLPTLPAALAAVLAKPNADRSDADRRQIRDAFVKYHPSFDERRTTLAALKKQLAGLKPDTTVPVMRELAASKHRETYVHLRGSYLSKGDKVDRGVPAAFHDYKGERPMNEMDRLDLANWLMDPANPLTSRVIANRFWEKLFGIGIVSTSEEFGSQGERPSHPDLLDHLATHLVDTGWDTKAFLKYLVTSAAYRQTSHVTSELDARDPANRLLARGPRVRLAAEMVRDQALFAAGLLSPKMYGPPVRPPQPNLGLKAAFGRGVDWKTSTGEDKFRRGLYTTWRRSSPYPSMAAFDAPNREVCTLRRDRTNTPLQALVTLNDPVYIEAAQALARRMLGQDLPLAEQLAHGFRLCLARAPNDAESKRMEELFTLTRERYAADATAAKSMATNPIGMLPDGIDVTDAAAMTIVANVLLNLDEMLMKR